MSSLQSDSGEPVSFAPRRALEADAASPPMRRMSSVPRWRRICTGAAIESEGTDAKAARRAAEIEAALKRLKRLSEKMMQLARAEGGRMRTGGSDIRSSSGSRGDFERPPRPAPQPKLPEDPLSDIDPDAFAILCRNLIENALKHGAAGTPVEVRLDSVGTFRVVNGGPQFRPRRSAADRPFRAWGDRNRGQRPWPVDRQGHRGRRGGGALPQTSPATGAPERFRGGCSATLGNLTTEARSCDPQGTTAPPPARPRRAGELHHQVGRGLFSPTIECFLPNEIHGSHQACFGPLKPHLTRRRDRPRFERIRRRDGPLPTA